MPHSFVFQPAPKLTAMMGFPFILLFKRKSFTYLSSFGEGLIKKSLLISLKPKGLRRLKFLSTTWLSSFSGETFLFVNRMFKDSLQFPESNPIRVFALLKYEITQLLISP